MTGIPHRAAYREGEKLGTWDGGCTTCRVSFAGEIDEMRAAAWVAGHNSAVHCIATADVPVYFPPTGPGDAITLRNLAALVDHAAITLGTYDAEIVMPETIRPLLHVFTPPSEDGWKRERLGVMILEGAGAFIRAGGV